MSVVVGGPVRAGVEIGDTSTPDFCRLPDPARLFELRAGRLAALSRDHPAAAYLRFLSALAEAQHAAVGTGAGFWAPGPDHLARCREHAMPPLRHLPPQEEASWRPALDAILAGLRRPELPETVGTALDRLAAADDARMAWLARAALAGEVAPDDLAEALFVFAALQVELTKLAGLLDPASLVPVGDGACPACGSPPVASLVVGWPKSQGARYLACSLCGTAWNHVRVKCTGCGSTKGVAYHGIDGHDMLAKGETCESCHGYLKIFQQQKDPLVDAVADDVASLGLDLMLEHAGWHPIGRNMFLLGS